jgi:Ca2+-transporting ATPase
MIESANPASKPSSAEHWFALDPVDVARDLAVGPDSGLTAGEAASRLQRNGPNALPTEKPPSNLRRFLGQYTSYMQLILVGAAMVSLFIQQWATAGILIAITLLNAVIGMRQEGKAASAMNALKSMMKASARVRRDGTQSVIPAEQVVVGDVVLITAGDEVPADGRLIAASSLQIDESALTGESVPAAKAVPALPDGKLTPADESNMAFMNTPVTHGSGAMIVTATGSDTEVGRIAHMLASAKPEKTPLTKEMDALTLWIIGAAGVTMVIMFVLGLQRGQPADVLFVSAVALAISAIPEALPTVVQVVLSQGSLDLANRKAIVKDLPSVETLGFTSAINSDKTGTLTMNQMTATELVDPTDRYEITGVGYDLAGEVTHAAGTSAALDDAVLPYVIASDAELIGGKVVGDPTEGALLVLAHKAGLEVAGSRERLPRLATLPFDPSYKLMATFNQVSNGDGKKVVRCFVKGAAPAVVSRSSSALDDGHTMPWSPELSHWAHDEIIRMEGEGLRVMAGAWRDIEADRFDATGDLLSHVHDLELASLVGMVDPPREQSAGAVAAATAANVRVRMVTGDDVTTGAAIARQVGIKGDAILGADFAALSDEERLARIDSIGVVGRVAPEHKVLLAETLKQKGDVVAMTGDGVNDAPAIKAADIGIAMGTGTEVAKNAGRMILSDDNFATIVEAVAEGRKLYDNLSKYIRFVLILLVAFVATFLGASLFDIASGQPFTPAQVLWIHFIVSAPFGIALGFDQATPGLMQRRPQPRGQSMLTRTTLIGCGLTGVAMAVLNLALIEIGWRLYGSTEVAASIGFTGFILMLIVGAYECRSQTGSVFARDTFDSRRMNWIAVAELAGAVLATSSDFFGHLLNTKQLTAPQFGLALLAALVLLAVWEAGKWFARGRLASQSRVPATGARGQRTATS